MALIKKSALKTVESRHADAESRMMAAAAESRQTRLRVMAKSMEAATSAWGVLHEIMLDREAPAVARRLCALDILNMAGAGTDAAKADATANHDKPLHEMSAQELRQMLDRQRQAVGVLEEGLRGEVIQGESRAVTVIHEPESGAVTACASDLVADALETVATVVPAVVTSSQADSQPKKATTTASRRRRGTID